MDSFKETIYFYREKEDNWDIVDRVKELGFFQNIPIYNKSVDDLKYLGSEVEMEIEINERCQVKVLSINGIDISDKDVYI